MSASLIVLATFAPDGASIVGGDALVSSISHDSRRIQPGGLFCCAPGDNFDGHDFARTASERGASALLVERLVGTGVPELLVPNVRRAMGPLAAQIFDNPSHHMDVVGVTGTNGKTTTSWLLHAILESAGRRCGLLGTLSGSHTTPEAPDFQERLAEFFAAGCVAVSLEASSHGLALGRVDGTKFAVGIFTNFSQDHLDLHGDEDQYFAAKARLFDANRCALAVVNVDDERGAWLQEHLDIPVRPFSLADATDRVLTASTASYTWRGQRVHLSFGGEFTIANALAASEAALALGLHPSDIARGLEMATPVPGRFEPVQVGQPFEVIVDYAHTPDGLANAIRAARQVTSGDVCVVFGCGGDRDRTKRAAMGAVASELGDRLVLTSDNPRTEDPAAIISDVRAGIPPSRLSAVIIEVDRRTAIRRALQSARANDCVLIAGKGHETTQTIGTTRVPFDDRVVARELLAAMPYTNEASP